MVVIVGFVGARTTGAMDIVVANNADSGNGTLRQAVQFNESLGGGDRILFSNITRAAPSTSGRAKEQILISNIRFAGRAPSG
jgi:hypothetical protein